MCVLLRISCQLSEAGLDLNNATMNNESESMTKYEMSFVFVETATFFWKREVVIDYAKAKWQPVVM